jgi:hypothetical protein
MDYPVLKLNPMKLNRTEASSKMKDLGFLYNNSNSSVTSTNTSLLIQNDDNSTYIGNDGYFEYNNKKSIYVPKSKEVIELDSNLINKSQVQENIYNMLISKGIINSTWILLKNLTQYRIYFSENTTVILHYYFKYVPVHLQIPMIDSKAPYVSIRIDPSNNILQFIMRIVEIQETSDTRYKITSAPDVLYELDYNHTKYSISNQTIIFKMELCYRRHAYEGSLLYPNWRITYDYSQMSYKYLEDYREK